MMQDNRGVAKILIIISSVLFFSAIAIAIIIFNKEDKGDVNLLQEINKSLSLDERAEGLIPENVIINNSTENFLRGTVVDQRDGLQKDFYAIKINDIWRIVEVSNTPVSCERFARLGFPSAFISDCRLSFSDAVTISEIDATLDNFFLESTELKIIGVVESVEYTEEGKVLTVTSYSGDSSIKINVESDFETQKGDLIITQITPPIQYNPNSQTNSETIYDSNNSIIANQEDRELLEDVNQNTDQNGQQGEQSIKIDKVTNSILKIDAPKSSAPPSYFFNAYDRDNSFIDIELEGSF